MVILQKGSVTEVDICGDSSTVERAGPPAGGGSSPASSLQSLVVKVVSVAVARDFIAAHHSRLPQTQKGPWLHAFGAYLGGELVATALWHNCSARGLPQNWRELRRMAISAGAPRNTASFMLARMCSWFRKNTDAEAVISYQDLGVHHGTIYRASNWTPVSVSRPRFRNREPLRTNTTRKYRSDLNGAEPAASAKIRWQMGLRGQKFESLSAAQIGLAKDLKPTK